MKIIIETDILEEMQAKLDSGEMIRIPGGFVIHNPDYKAENGNSLPAQK